MTYEEFEEEAKRIYEKYTKIAIDNAKSLGDEIERIAGMMPEEKIDTAFIIVAKYEDKMGKDIMEALK